MLLEVNGPLVRIEVDVHRLLYAYYAHYRSAEMRLMRPQEKGKAMSLMCSLDPRLGETQSIQPIKSTYCALLVQCTIMMPNYGALRAGRINSKDIIICFYCIFRYHQMARILLPIGTCIRYGTTDNDITGTSALTHHFHASALLAIKRANSIEHT